MITVIGAGTGPAASAETLAEATLVVGARRHLDAVPLPPGAERVVLGPLAPALDAVEEHLYGADGGEGTSGRGSDAGPGTGSTAVPRKGVGTGAPAESRSAESRSAESHSAEGDASAAARVVVLASGDPGFFGIVRALAGRFGPSALRVEPSVPSVALAFARAGLPWDDAAVVSAHGRDPRTAVNVCRAHPKTAVLTGPECGPAELGAALSGTGIPRTLVVATALGQRDERVESLSPAEAAARAWPDPVSVVLCLDPARAVPPAQGTVAGGQAPRSQWALQDEEFEHRDSMVTKFEVRALALARMAPGRGDLVWDVGAGSGSVAVECARLGAASVAVERAGDAVGRIRANAAAHGVDVQTVHGEAPAALARLPDPDAVFVGGGGRDLPAVVAACAARARRCVVVTLAALDRVPEVRAALSGAGLACEGVLLNSSRLAPLPGDVTRLAATNPVFVLWGTRDTGDAGRPPPDAPPREPARTGEAADSLDSNGTSEGAAP